MKSDRIGIGRRAEDLACACLEANGLRIVARNWRRREGEIDVVADDGGTCVFVEVRSRTGEERGHALETVTPRKRAQVIRAARLYLASGAPASSGYRFDVVAVTFFDDGHRPEVSHLANAFEVG